MEKSLSNQEKKLDAYIVAGELIRKAGKEGNLGIAKLQARILHRDPLKAAKAFKLVQAHVKSKAVANMLDEQYRASLPVQLKQVDPRYAFCLAIQDGTEEAIEVDYRSLFEESANVAIFGAPGTGKSTLALNLILQAHAKSFDTTLGDRKGNQGKRIRHINPITVSPDRELINWLDPMVEVEAARYASGFAGIASAYLRLHDLTTHHLHALILRLYASRRPGSPFPSLKDLEKAAFELGPRERNQSLLTVARSTAALTAQLGYTAHIQKAPPQNRNAGRFTIYDFSGYDPNSYAFLSALRFLRRQIEAKHTPSGRLRPLMHVEDEAAHLANSDVFERMSAELRGAKVVLVCLFQTISLIKSAILSNFAVNVAFQVNDPDEARQLQKRLLLPEQDGVQRILSLPPRMCYIRFPGVNRPILARVPDISF